MQTVLEFLGAGDSVEDVLEEYPDLTREDVQACPNYAFSDRVILHTPPPRISRRARPRLAAS